MTTQVLLNAQAAVSWISLALFAGLLAYEYMTARRDKRPIYGLRVSWLVHAVIYYFAAAIARSYGIRVGDVSATLLFTLWSSALRIHFGIGIFIAIKLGRRL